MVEALRRKEQEPEPGRTANKRATVGMCVNRTEVEGRCVCPLCGEYEGSRASVEAHISSRVDEDHRGSLGEHYRDELVADVAGEGDPAADNTYQASGEGVETTGGGTSYARLDVDPGKALLLATVVFAVVVGWSAVQGSDQDDGDQEDVEEEDAETDLEPQVPTGGVEA